MILKQTTDSRLAAAITTLHHALRDEDPCVWMNNAGREQCTFFFEDGQPAPLTIEQIKAAWDEGTAFGRMEQFLIGILPEDQHPEALALLHEAAVNAMRLFAENYRHPIMATLKRSKEEIGLYAEHRGGKTLLAGRKLGEADIAALKKEGNF